MMRRPERTQGNNGFILSRDLRPRLVPLAGLTPMGRHARKHPSSQIGKLAGSLREFGFVAPIVVGEAGGVIAGWAVVLAARRLGLTEVPAVTVSDLSEAELRALRLALNRLGEDSGWDREQLALEFADLSALDPQFDLTLTGFEMGEIDLVIGEGAAESAEDDFLAEVDANALVVSRAGDLWSLGEHRLHCADATKAESYARVMDSDVAEMVFADPPYNVPINGHASGLGRNRHRDFAMAAGEMSPGDFTEFLASAFRLMAAYSVDGAIHYVCMDWRHMTEIRTAGRSIYSELKNLCVWSKTNGGMGSLYRSAHELVFVFKAGKAPHINNVELGRHGRNRTNVWLYPGAASFGAGRDVALAMHPTVKPVALIADAILDCSRRNGLILDPFVGSGTTIIAAERTGRRARAIELDPKYVDAAVRRWQAKTGRAAIHAETRESFNDVAARMANPAEAGGRSDERIG
jgi:DNA modification methylase